MANKEHTNTHSRTNEYHKQVAEQIISMIESGTAPWQLPWEGINPFPINGKTGNSYNGINCILLSYLQTKRGYTDPRWMTFKQISDAGGKVKQGEKGTRIEYWMHSLPEKDENGNIIKDEDGNTVYKELKNYIPKYYTVFNIAQTEGIPPYVRPHHEWQPSERAERILKASEIKIYHDQMNRNFYSPIVDEIHLTPKDSFPTPDAYYGTALHELSHSTGHPTRLNRPMKGKKDIEEYAKEELRAEIASFMLCNQLGINHNHGANEQHASYVGSWIKALKNDYNEIFRAASSAKEICDYLYKKEEVYIQSLKNGLEPNQIELPSPSITEETSDTYGHALYIGESSNINQGSDTQNKKLSDTYYTKRDLDMSQNLKGANIMSEEKQNQLVEGKNERKTEFISPTLDQLKLAKKYGLEVTEKTSKKSLSSRINKAILAERDKIKKELQASVPLATPNQIKAILVETGKEPLPNLTKDDASKIIGNFPATKDQLMKLGALKIKYHEGIKRKAAADLLRQYNIDHKNNGNTLANEKQLEYLDLHKVKYSENITFKEAWDMVGNKKAYVETAKLKEPTKRQINAYGFYGGDIKDLVGKTREQVATAVHEQKFINRETISDEQLRLCKKFGIDYEGKNKLEVGKALGISYRKHCIQNFNPDKPSKKDALSRATKIYMLEAKQMMINGKELDDSADKKIAADLLCKDFTSRTIAQALYQHSPNLVYDKERCTAIVTSAKKTPRVQEHIKVRNDKIAEAYKRNLANGMDPAKAARAAGRTNRTII